MQLQAFKVDANCVRAALLQKPDMYQASALQELSLH